jgi:hypothetical protein
VDKRIKVVTYKPIRHPFIKGKGRRDEKEEAKAYRKVFTDTVGAKVLDALVLDMNYHEFIPPSEPMLMAFENGKRYVVNHILRAIAAEYSTEDVFSNNYMEINDDGE